MMARARHLGARLARIGATVWLLFVGLGLTVFAPVSIVGHSTFGFIINLGAGPARYDFSSVDRVVVGLMGPLLVVAAICNLRGARPRFVLAAVTMNALFGCCLWLTGGRPEWAITGVATGALVLIGSPGMRLGSWRRRAIASLEP